jgi:hypothetical protein
MRYSVLLAEIPTCHPIRLDDLHVKRTPPQAHCQSRDMRQFLIAKCLNRQKPTRNSMSQLRACLWLSYHISFSKWWSPFASGDGFWLATFENLVASFAHYNQLKHESENSIDWHSAIVIGIFACSSVPSKRERTQPSSVNLSSRSYSSICRINPLRRSVPGGKPALSLSTRKEDFLGLLKACIACSGAWAILLWLVWDPTGIDANHTHRESSQKCDCRIESFGFEGKCLFQNIRNLQRDEIILCLDYSGLELNRTSIFEQNVALWSSINISLYLSQPIVDTAWWNCESLRRARTESEFNWETYHRIQIYRCAYKLMHKIETHDITFRVV